MRKSDAFLHRSERRKWHLTDKCAQPGFVGFRTRLCETASLDLILAVRFSRNLRGDQMRRFVGGADRGQSTLFPERVEDWIGEDNPVRVLDVFVDELDLAGLGFGGVAPELTGRPSYHPAVLL